MKGKTLKIVIYVSILAWTLILICLSKQYFQSKNQPKISQEIKETEIPLAQNIYDSEDTAIILHKDTQNNTIQFQNIQTGKKYTLAYDGATDFQNKYEEQMAIPQLYSGMLTTIRFYKENKKLVSLQENNTCFRLEHLTNYKIDVKNSVLKYKDNAYKFNKNMVIFSGDTQIDFMDLNEIDEISISGFSDQINSIVVERGHSYLRLQNETYFIDGWIEIGKDIIKKVTEDMLITVPEGKNTVSVSHKGNSATQTIDFPKNEEISWDLGTVEINLPKTGNIIFTITPENATVTIDGEKKDHTSPIELSYGVHQLIIKAKDYETLSKYIKVGAPSANISVDLEPKEKKDTNDYPEKNTEKMEEETDETKQTTPPETNDKNEENQQNKESKEKTETEKQTDSADHNETSSTTYKIHIDSPEGAEVYLDGNYIGIAPLSIPKKPGSYIITLRKEGYQTRSYTLQVDDEEKDVNYSFSELTKKTGL